MLMTSDAHTSLGSGHPSWLRAQELDIAFCSILV